MLPTAGAKGLASSSLPALHNQSRRHNKLSAAQTQFLSPSSAAGLEVHLQRTANLALTARDVRPSAKRTQVNFVKASDELHLPFDIYKVLQVSSVASRDSCSKALDHLLRNPPPGFSHQALYSRAALLQRSADILLDATARRLYDQGVLQGDPKTAFASSEVAGALMLLQECGQWEPVVRQGTNFLESVGPQEGQAGDVAVAVAQAWCDAAAVVLEGEAAGSAAQACDHLQAALAVLQAHSASPQLQRDIHAAIGEMAPNLVKQQLGLPLGEPGRARGLATLKQLVAQAAPGWTDLLDACRPHLSSSEVVDLAEATGSGSSRQVVPAFEVALALLVSGCQRFEPQLVQEAFKRMQEAAPEGQGDVAVPFAVCCLLLGDSPAAESILGFGASPAGMPVDPAVQAFIKDNCTDEADLLPGLCLLAEQWLGDVAFDSFCDIRGSSLSLAVWFDNPKVASHLRGTGDTPGASLGKAFNAASSRVAAAAGTTASFVTHAARAAKQLLPRFPDKQQQPSPSPMTSPHEPVQQSMQAQPSHTPAASPKSNSRPVSAQRTSPLVSQSPVAPNAEKLSPKDLSERPSTQGPVNDSDERVSMVTASMVIEPPAAQIDSAGPPRTAASAEARRETAGNEASEPKPRRRIRQQMVKPGTTFAVSSVDGGVVDGIISFKEEREMWTGTSTQSPIRRLVRRLFGWAIILAAAVLGALAMGFRPPTRITSPPGPAALGTSATYHSQEPAGTAALNVEEAQQLLQQWQAIKAQALGPKHDTTCLHGILEGSMLERWTAHVADSVDNNQNVNYGRMEFQIDAVEMHQDTARVLATFQEEATVQVQGRPADSIQSTYSMEYHLVRHPSGWKLFNSATTS
ncbi:hypothetical protein WJX74_001777 [Apatococcus lobatus]|uniref:ARC6 IMS domain-containing protein n=1 Tax=Apatococcus lobatus TaxID=904363 RepID=A0AAW1QDE7_9CHLO